MAIQSIEFTKRQLTRARVTAQAVLAAPEGQQIALKVLAPDMIAQCDAYEAAVRGSGTVCWSPEHRSG